MFLKTFVKVGLGFLLGAGIAAGTTTAICKNGKKIQETFGKKKRTQTKKAKKPVQQQ